MTKIYYRVINRQPCGVYEKFVITVADKARTGTCLSCRPRVAGSISRIRHTRYLNQHYNAEAEIKLNVEERTKTSIMVAGIIY